jgi:transposase
MKLYSAFDLHSNNCYLGIIDQAGKRIAKKKLPNDPELILQALIPYSDDIVGVVIESTYNWYWLVDMLMENGYQTHLANPSTIQKYSGLKHADDVHDAFWLAEMLRLGILPEGYIYPKQDRPIRDLLRKRGHLVKLRTSLIISLQHIITRNYGVNVSVNDIKAVKTNRVESLFGQDDDLALSGQVSKQSIDFLTGQIRMIEQVVGKRKELSKPYQQLKTIPGIGKILALTIELETGSISRFNKVGNYVSYCRKVPTKWTSNGKSKGKGNKKNGNKYLAWAFSEAAELSRRYDEDVRRFYNRKLQRTNRMVAHTALAHKLARASYYIMRDEVPFMPDKLFC